MQKKITNNNELIEKPKVDIFLKIILIIRFVQF